MRGRLISVPSRASRFSASRSGVRLTPNAAERCTSLMRSPAGSRPSTMRLRSSLASASLRLSRTGVHGAVCILYTVKRPVEHCKRPEPATGANKKGAGTVPAPLKFNPGGSHGIVHLELDRVGGVFEGMHLAQLQLDVAVDEIVVEHAALLQEGAVAVEALQRLPQGTADRRDFAQLLRRQGVQVLVHR